MDLPGVEGTGPVHAPLFVRVLFKRHKVKAENSLSDGSTVGPFTVIHLPGHTPGSVAYYHKARSLLFTGDALITGHSGRLNLSKPSYNYDYQGATASLVKLSGLTPSAILPGHGAPVVAGATKALAEAIQRLTMKKVLPSPTFFGPEGRPEVHPGTPGWKEG
jgi:glyoxylase-like metal-dependent hydrolase (beta-lactamase superfamily II)